MNGMNDWGWKIRIWIRKYWIFGLAGIAIIIGYFQYQRGGFLRDGLKPAIYSVLSKIPYIGSKFHTLTPQYYYPPATSSTPSSPPPPTTYSSSPTLPSHPVNPFATRKSPTVAQSKISKSKKEKRKAKKKAKKKRSTKGKKQKKRRC